MSERIVIYHKGCPDGFGAAWCAWQTLGDTATYLPAAYGSDPPDVEGKDVYILDFSYKRPVMEELIGKARSLRCLDHHKTAEADLAGLDGCEFDMERSGAAMTWDYFVAGMERPWLINYVQDRDLWHWKLPDSEAVSAALMAEPHDFEAWNRLSARQLPSVVADGLAILRHIAHYSERVRENVEIDEQGDYVCAVVNIPYPNCSDVLYDVLEAHPEADIAINYFKRADGFWQHGMRSRKDGPDVSEIAAKFGGGGHRNAAGYQSRDPW